jgi:hypothetical protein
MTTPTTSIVSDIYHPTVLATHLQPFINQSLESIDTTHETIFKVQLVVTRSPFQKKLISERTATYSRYTKLKDSNEHTWNPLPGTVQLPIYTQFLGQQKQAVKTAISEDLQKNWTDLAEAIAQFIHHGPLAYVEGEVTISIETTDKTTGSSNPVKNFQSAFAIYDQRICSLI